MDFIPLIDNLNERERVSMKRRSSYERRGGCMNNLIESLLATFQSKDSHSFFPLVYGFMLFCFSCRLSTILGMKGGEESFFDNSK